LGLIAYNQGNLQRAIGYYKQIFSHNPTSKEAEAALTALEEIYVDDLGQTDEYFAFLESIPGYKVGSDEKEAISFKAAESQFENGNYEKAIENYGDFLRKYPNGRNALLAHYHRGESYSVLNKYSEALIDYDFVIQKGQSVYYTKSLLKAGLIAYNHEQDFNKAFSYYSLLETAASDDDSRFEAQLGAMRSAYRINNSSAVFSMAGKVSQNPKATDDQKATAYFYLGKIYSDQKDFSKALSSLNQVTKLSNNEQTAEARYLIAYIYYVQRDLDVAQQLCLNANKESAGYNYWIAKSVILLADILAEKGDLFNAQAALEGLIENYDEDKELVSIAKAKLQQLKTNANSSNRLLDDSDDSSFEMDEEQR
jgi:tetratricopeptide (TPR) repeat protein